MNKRFIAWKRSSPYNIAVESDPENADRELLVAYLDRSLDPLIHVDVGMVINSMRAALDILMTALLAGHGIKPEREAHFPIRDTRAKFLAAIATFERKEWISSVEAAAIKDTEAYKGGDDVLYRVHQLDILRKHERLLKVGPVVRQTHVAMSGPGFEQITWQADDKTILGRFPRGGFSPTKSDTQIAPEIFLDEPTLGVARQPAVLVLRRFAARIRDIIQNFP